jgi:very-short-patch-repair endonuclease
MHLKANSIDGWVSNYRFHSTRRWRIDFAWPNQMLAVEIEGAVWGAVIEFLEPARARKLRSSGEVRYAKGQKVTLAGGGHSRGAGMEKDMAKYNTLSLLGWRLLRFSVGMVEDGSAVALISQAVRMPSARDMAAVDAILARKGGDGDGESEEGGEEEAATDADSFVLSGS